MLGDQRAAHVVAVHAREVTIEHHDVIAQEGDMGERVRSVVGDVDGHALSPEPLGHGIGESPVIFRNQNPHRSVLPAPHRMPESR